jgi:hypothetical protein
MTQRLGAMLGLVTVRGNVDVLVADLERSIAEADAVIKAMDSLDGNPGVAGSGRARPDDVEAGRRLRRRAE